MLDRSLVIFRRDLRLTDNAALISASAASREILPCFFLDPRQVEEHPYRSTNAIQFMVESLKELEGEIEAAGGMLKFYYGKAEELLPEIVKTERIGAVFANRDYTPFSRRRDEALARVLDGLGVKVHFCGDALLNEPEAITKADGGRYTVFTPFFRRASLIPVSLPNTRSVQNFGRFFDPPSNLAVLAQPSLATTRELFMRGGRRSALSILDRMEAFQNYAHERDFPAKAATTGLSAHLKFGTVSPREVYSAVERKLGTHHPLIRQLYWRDFFTQIAFHHPRVFGQSFYEQYDKIEWDTDERLFHAWCEGRTGFPIVDAGMRQLNATGFMHNRARMITASFLVKDLLIDWRWGEKYFARQLTCYDPALNNGNWQWAASTGCDAQPYFRIFNPWLQQKRFDPEALYVKEWIPELRPLPSKLIHRPEAERPGYSKSIVDHEEQKLRAERAFAEALKRAL